jgi:predicted anti-sigma-YlaC factor YlaD
MRYPMKCHSVQKKLSAYQDTELETHEREQVKEHLLNCRTCREQYAELERVWQTLGEFEEIRPNPWFYQQIVRKIKEPREQRLFPGLQWAPRLLPAPVIVFILLVVGILTGTYLGKILAQSNMFLLHYEQASETVFNSMRVFDPAPPGTLAEGYFRMVSYKEDDSR